MSPIFHRSQRTNEGQAVISYYREHLASLLRQSFCAKTRCCPKFQLKTFNHFSLQINLSGHDFDKPHWFMGAELQLDPLIPSFLSSQGTAASIRVTACWRTWQTPVCWTKVMSKASRRSTWHPKKATPRWWSCCCAREPSFTGKPLKACPRQRFTVCRTLNEAFFNISSSQWLQELDMPSSRCKCRIHTNHGHSPVDQSQVTG